MNKWIREKLDTWDIKSAFLIIIFFSIGIFLFFYFSDIRDRLRESDKNKFDGRAMGHIVSIEKIDRISQSKWKGTKIYPDSYKVTYSYNFKGHIFENTDLIPASMTNEKFLSEILTRKPNATFVVHVDLNAPQQSLLVGSE